MYAGKRTLVTGGTGSFGQTMVRRMLAADVAEVRVLSRDEGKHDQMRVELAVSRVAPTGRAASTSGDPCARLTSQLVETRLADDVDMVSQHAGRGRPSEQRAERELPTRWWRTRPRGRSSSPPGPAGPPRERAPRTTHCTRGLAARRPDQRAHRAVGGSASRRTCDG